MRATASKPRTQADRRTLHALVALALVSRLLLLDWNGAEYSDGVHFMSLSELGQNKRLPVYSLLIQFVHLFVPSLMLSGRLVSMLIFSASVFPFFAIARRLYGREAATYATVLYLVSPVITRWSIRVMAESTFLFLLLAAAHYFLEWLEERRSGYVAGVIALFGVAAMTRPEGLAFLPVSAAFGAYVLYKSGSRVIGWLLLGSTPWVLQLLWHWKIAGRYGYGEELVQAGVDKLTMLKFFAHIILYPVHLPYVMTPIVFGFGLYGVYKSVRGVERTLARKCFHVFCLYMGTAWLIPISLHWAWTTRFLFPLIALLLIFAGYGLTCLSDWRVKRAAFAVSLLTSAALTIPTLLTSRGKFADVLQAAYFVRDRVPASARVVSSEVPKTRFWAERDIVEYRRQSVEPGTYVALQSMYSDVDDERSYLARRYEIDVVFETRVSIRQLLSDENNRLQRPTSLFAPIHYKSVVLRLKARRPRRDN